MRKHATIKATRKETRDYFITELQVYFSRIENYMVHDTSGPAAEITEEALRILNAA
jgi:hypothetical protein